MIRLFQGFVLEWPKRSLSLVIMFVLSESLARFWLSSFKMILNCFSISKRELKYSNHLFTFVRKLKTEMSKIQRIR